MSKKGFRYNEYFSISIFKMRYFQWLFIFIENENKNASNVIVSYVRKEIDKHMDKQIYNYYVYNANSFFLPTVYNFGSTARISMKVILWGR